MVGSILVISEKQSKTPTALISQSVLISMKKIVSLLVPVFICFLVGWTASYFQSESLRSWYPLLNKPALTPPNAAFPIAWGIIYLCMGISAGLVFRSGSQNRATLLALFTVQLFLNFLWSILFFYFRNPLMGFIDILVLDAGVIIYAIKSYKANKLASWLFVPYILWLCLATYLNGYIWLNN